MTLSSYHMIKPHSTFITLEPLDKLPTFTKSFMLITRICSPLKEGIIVIKIFLFQFQLNEKINFETNLNKERKKKKRRIVPYLLLLLFVILFFKKII